MSAFEQSVLANLESQGWKIGKRQAAREGLMFRLNDGAGSTFAQTLIVKESLAVLTSHRGDIDLPPPWRPGRPAADGSPTAFITARDLGIVVPRSVSPAPRAPAPAPGPEPVDRECVAAILEAWRARIIPSDRHPQLSKGGAWVHSCGLREFPPGHAHAGDLFAPMFRPVAPGSLSIELCGAQQLLKNINASQDKYIMPGSRAAGAFVPLLLRESFFSDGTASFSDCLEPDSGRKSRIVVVEGVRTGQAIYTATADWSLDGNNKQPKTVVLAALSANNLPAVARWLKESGLSSSNEIVFAADNDLARSSFVGIRKAVEAAELCGGKVALVDNDVAGFDAHDLLKSGGIDAVRGLIDNARTTEQIRADRAEAFAPTPVKWPERVVCRGHGIGR